MIVRSPDVSSMPEPDANSSTSVAAMVNDTSIWSPLIRTRRKSVVDGGKTMPAAVAKEAAQAMHENCNQLRTLSLPDVGDLITNFSAAADSKGAVVSMADMSTLEVEADVSESNLSKIKVGQPCEIQLDAFPEQRFRGEVSRLVPTVDRAKASVLTKIRFLDPDARVLPEMSAKIAFLSRAMNAAERQPRTAVHGDAIVVGEGDTAVFRVEDGLAKRVTVKPGAKIGDLVELAGVQPGDRLVLRPPASLRDGAAVSVGK